MKAIFLLLFCILLIGCHSPIIKSTPKIEFTKIPIANPGGPDKMDIIAGKVSGADSRQKIILYAKSGIWWIQPFYTQYLTDIQNDLTWQNSTHLGTEYAAILVEPDYKAPAKIEVLPSPGDGIIAVASVKGTETGDSETPPKTIKFSGYDWKVRSMPSNRGGMTNQYNPANAWVDEKGFLHLRITRDSEQNWNCAEINLTRSLGYGTYNITVQDVSNLEPAAVFSMFTWDELESGQNYREMNLEVTRLGDPTNKNLRYVVQPFYIPTNIVQFSIPGGTLTHSLHWKNGQAQFKTVAGSTQNKSSKPISEYTFSSSVPSAGRETLYLIFYVFGYAKQPLEKETEIVIEKFEFLP